MNWGQSVGKLWGTDFDSNCYLSQSHNCHPYSGATEEARSWGYHSCFDMAGLEEIVVDQTLGCCLYSASNQVDRLLH